MNATINFEIRENKEDANGECPLYLRITYNRKPSWMSLGFKVKPSDWNKDKQLIRRSNSRYKVLNDQLLKTKAKAHDAILELKEIDKLDSKRVVAMIKGHDNKEFFTYAKKYIDSVRDSGSIRLAKNTQVIVNKIKGFAKSDSLSFNSIDLEFIENLSSYMRIECENHNNTIRKNLQFLGGIIKSANRDGFVNGNPLDNYQLPTYQKPKKEALSYDEILAIQNLELEEGSNLWHTRNYFLFSFYNAGVRFGDICKLKVGDVQDGRLKYLMSKTSNNSNPKWKNIKLLPEALEILELYDYDKRNNDEYLFPIVNTSKKLDNPIVFDKEKQSQNTQANKRLKKIAELAGINQSLSTHIARHSFANYALKKGMSVYSISKALAHSDLKTTESYLNSFDEELLDEEMDNVFS